MNEYELQRSQRLEENRKRMEAMGLMRQKAILESLHQAGTATASRGRKPKQPRLQKVPVSEEPRRSKRIMGEKIDYCEIGANDLPMLRSRGTEHGLSLQTCGEYHELLDLMGRGRNRGKEEAVTADKHGETQQEMQDMQEKLQQMRCSSQGRGSVYDSAIGITCHFCRQKKLCGEQGCPRCQHRDSNKECIGKTECSKCHSAFGRFCRACLLIRYGQTLEEVTKEREGGTWLCPHCYCEENPKEGWICNSSICMKRQGLKPTGVAIYAAMDQGYKSVAHLLQVELQKNGGVGKLLAAAQQGAQEEADQADGGATTSGQGEASTAVVEGAAADAAATEKERAVAGKEAAAAEKGHRGRGRFGRVLFTNAAVVPDIAKAAVGEEAVATQLEGRGGVKHNSQEALEGGEQQEQGPRESRRTRTRSQGAHIA